MGKSPSELPISEGDLDPYVIHVFWAVTSLDPKPGSQLVHPFSCRSLVYPAQTTLCSISVKIDHTVHCIEAMQPKSVI